MPAAEDVTLADLLRPPGHGGPPVDGPRPRPRRRASAAIGLVDEEIPGSYARGLRLAPARRRGRADRGRAEPARRRCCGTGPRTSTAWRTISDALQYLLRKHPGFADDPRGLARVQGQIAFAHAALGERPQARTWAVRALRRSWRERRAYLALLVSLRLLTADRVLRMAHATGRGI